MLSPGITGGRIVAAMQHSAGPYMTVSRDPQRATSASVGVSPPTTTVSSVGTSSGESRRATDGVVVIHVASNRRTVSARRLRRSSSDGIQRQAPVISDASRSLDATSKACDENCSTRADAVRVAANTWPRILEQAARWSTTAALGVPVDPEVKTTYAGSSGEAASVRGAAR